MVENSRLPADRLAVRDRFLEQIRQGPVVMGILNVTPDSFSDGGLFATTQSAERRARAMLSQGCAILDIGGESTRPGHTPIHAAEECARVLPVLDRLAGEGAAISIDTTKAEVARAAAARGAVVINDVWGLQKDPDMAATVAQTGCAVVVMHNRAAIDASLDIHDELRRFFDRSLELAQRAGIPNEHVILDPGIGFGKSLAQNLAAIWGLDRLAEYGLPVLLGLSRKSFIGKITGASVDERLTGTLSANLVGLMRGAAILRVHDVAEHREAIAMFQALKG